MTIPFRPLGKVMEMASSTGLDISYAYDDLAFSDHSVYIIRFDDQLPDLLHIYFNHDCEENTVIETKKKLIESSALNKLCIHFAGKFILDSIHESEELKIEFINTI